MSTTYLVAFYEIDRAYGGSEEGGWWYNTGQLVRVFKTTKNRNEAVRIANRANDLLKLIQRKDYRNGTYQAEICENKADSYYPTERPYYS